MHTHTLARSRAVMSMKTFLVFRDILVWSPEGRKHRSSIYESRKKNKHKSLIPKSNQLRTQRVSERLLKYKVQALSLPLSFSNSLLFLHSLSYFLSLYLFHIEGITFIFYLKKKKILVVPQSNNQYFSQYQFQFQIGQSYEY